MGRVMSEKSAHRLLRYSRTEKLAQNKVVTAELEINVWISFILFGDKINDLNKGSQEKRRIPDPC